MKKSNGWLVFLLWFGITFTVIPFIINDGIMNKEREINSIYGFNKIDVHMKDVYEATSVFTLDDVEKLQNELGNQIISYSSVDYSVVSTKDRYLNPVRITGTDFLYCYFNNLNIVKGSYFTKKAEKANERIAIIDTETAWFLFNTLDVLNYKIKIYNEEFTIIGLSGKSGNVDQSGNVKEDIIEKKINLYPYHVYIPASVFFAQKGNENISALSIYSEKSNVIDNEIETALRHIGKESSQYIITDYHEQNWLLSQKNRIFRVLISAGLVLHFILIVAYILKDVIARIEAGKKNVYLVQALRKNSRAITMALLKLLIIGSSVFIIIKLAAFDLYIPREYIPERLIDTDFYRDVSAAAIQNHNAGLMSVDLNANRFRMDISQQITTRLIIIGIPAGYLLSVMIVIIMARHIKLINTLTIILVLTIFICIVIEFYSINTLSLPPGGDWISIALYLFHMMVLATFIHRKRNHEGRFNNDEGNL